MSLLGREYRTVAPDGGDPVAPDADAPRIALHGVADAVAAGDLLGRCHDLRAVGHAEVVVDVAAALRCERPMLDVLQLLTRPPADGTGTRFRVEGARWPQFLAALEQAPLDELPRLCQAVDRLVPASEYTPA